VKWIRGALGVTTRPTWNLSHRIRENPIAHYECGWGSAPFPPNQLCPWAIPAHLKPNSSPDTLLSSSNKATVATTSTRLIIYKMWQEYESRIVADLRRAERAAVVPVADARICWSGCAKKPAPGHQGACYPVIVFLNECKIKRLKWVEEDVSMSMVAFDWQVSYISFLLVFKSDHRSTVSS